MLDLSVPEFPLASALQELADSYYSMRTKLLNEMHAAALNGYKYSVLSDFSTNAINMMKPELEKAGYTVTIKAYGNKLFSNIEVSWENKNAL